MYILSGRQAKAADIYAIKTMNIESLWLMENASRSAADHISANVPPSFPIVAACGVGNNGADGLCILSILAERGYKCYGVVVGNMEKATEEFSYQLDRARGLGVEVISWDDFSAHEFSYENRKMISEINSRALTDSKPEFIISDNSSASVPTENKGINEADSSDENKLSKTGNHNCPSKYILVDAIFGIGLSREVGGTALEAMKFFISQSGRVEKTFAVDIPSGINADTGEVMGTALKADVTITFGCNKHGLLTAPGSDYAGQVIVTDIGIPDEAYEFAMRQ